MYIIVAALCLGGAAAAPKAEPVPVGCIYKADLVIMLDGTIYAPPVNFTQIRDAVQQIIRRLGIDPINGFQIHIVYFDTIIVKEIRPIQAETKDMLANLVGTLQIRPPKGRVNFNDVLGKMKTILNARTRTANTRIIGLLITDSQSTKMDFAKMTAYELRNMGARLITWSIGWIPDYTEMASITQNINNEFRLENVAQMDVQIQDIVNRMCQFTDPCALSKANTGKKAHPLYCDQFITCMVGRSKIETCKRGMFFDPVNSMCADATELECAQDTCSMGPFKKYPMYGICSAFWVCQYKKTEGFACCAANHRFVNGMGCIWDSMCKDKCPTLPVGPMWTGEAPPPTTPPPTTTTAKPTTPPTTPTTTPNIPAW